ncbi:MAG: hypothetical protein K6E50_04455 [Lachnospiraceae bacterium]|nr:hypothetical protein [Lachnospiraceae bacterium]
MRRALLISVLLAAIADALLFCAGGMGWLTRTQGPERGTLAEVLAEEAAQQLAAEQKKAVGPAGSGWETSNGTYYFDAGGELYYFVSERTENYIRGNVSIREQSADELEETKGALLLGGVEDAHYFRVDVTVDQELYFGNLCSGNLYTLFLAMNGDSALILDSGWGEAMEARRVEYPLQAVLDDHFDPDKLAEVDVWGPAGRPEVFCREDVDFNVPDGGHEYWNAVQIGSRFFVRTEEGTIVEQGSTEALPLNLDGKKLTVFGTDGKDLIYGTGTANGSSYSTEALWRYDPAGGNCTKLVQDKVQDFIAVDDCIWYTDYTRLVKLSPDGSTKEYWNYGVYSYAVTPETVLVFDGDAWEILDADTGEDYGFIIDGKNYSCECDLVRYTEDYLYFVTYDYNRESISLRALNIWTGDERVVGQEYPGKKSDTYNVFFCDTYCYFTAENGERLVRVDVSSGSVQDRRLDDAGWWYVTEIVPRDGQPLLHAYDKDEKPLFLEVGTNLEMTLLFSGVAATEE